MGSTTEKLLRHSPVPLITISASGEKVTPRFRRILVSFENSTRLEAVERRGYRGYRPARTKPGQIAARSTERLRTALAEMESLTADLGGEPS